MFRCLPTFFILALAFFFSPLKSQSCLNCSSSLPINTGLIWCHNFNGNANDQTNNGYDGTTFQTTYINDRFGKPNSAVDFDGVSSYITIPKLIPTSLNTFSFSLWVKAGVNNGMGFILWEGDGNCGNDIFLVITNSDLKPGANKNANLNGLTTSSHVYTAPSNIIGNWNHIVWVVEPTNSKIYYNGILQKTIITTCNGSGFNFPFSYGSKYDGGNLACGVGRQFYYKGAIDDVRFYNRAITSSEAQQLYNLENTPEIVINPISDKTICLGDTIKLNPSVAGGTNFSWSPTTGISKTNVLNPNFAPTDTTTYILSASSGNCVTRDTVIINVNAVNISLGQDIFQCTGDSVKISGVATGAQTISWQPTIGVSNPTVLNPWIKGPGQTYIVTATSGICSNKDTIIVILKSVTLEMDDSAEICLGDSFQINLKTINLSNLAAYQWSGASTISNKSILNPKVYPLSNTYYKIEISDGICSFKDSILIKLTTPNLSLTDTISGCKSDTLFAIPNSNCSSFLWYPSSDIKNQKSKNQEFYPNTKGWYFLEGKLGNCKVIDSVFIKRNLIIVSKEDSLTICNGDTIQLSADLQNPTKYYWSPGQYLEDSTLLPTRAYPTITTNYKLIAENISGCSETSNIFVNVKNIQYTKSPDRNICKGDTIQISVSTNGLIIWNNKFNLFPSNSKNPKVFPDKDTTYTFSLLENTCSSRDSIRISIKSKPIVYAGQDTSFCFGGKTTLTAEVKNFSKYYWLNNKPNWQDSTDLNPEVSVTNEKDFVLFATNNGCENFDTVSVKEYPKVVANFTISPKSGIAPYEGFTVNNSIGADNYFWSSIPRGEFSDSIAFEPIFLLKDSGSFLVILYAENENGCWDTTSNLVEIGIEPYLHIPNVFTPNADSINDVFKVVYNPAAYEYLKIQIYSRWGELLYESRFPGGLWWDGTYNGKYCPDGVYFYIVNAKPKHRDQINLHGTVTLLR